MDILQLTVLAYIPLMMGLIFFLLYRIFRTSKVSKRSVFLLSFIILLMTLEISIIISTAVTGNFALTLLPLLIVPLIPLIISFRVKNEIVEWRKDFSIILTLAVSILIDEMAMGYAYSLVFGPTDLNPILASVSNLAFGIMMLSDALFLLLISKVRNIRDWILFTFATSMAFMPDIFYTYHEYIVLYSSILASIIMTVNIVLLYLVYMKRRYSLDFQVITLSIATFDFLMMLGLAIYSVSLDISFLSVVTTISMLTYFVLTFYRVPDKRVMPKFRQILAFVILINLAELAMGFGETVLGYNTTNMGMTENTASNMNQQEHSMSHMMLLQPTHSMMSNMDDHMVRMDHHDHMGDHGHSMVNFENPYWWIFPFNPWDMVTDHFNQAMMITGSLPYSIFSASWMLIMYTTMSPFYLIMMGSEMSFLVYHKLRSLRYKSNKAFLWSIIIGVPLFSIIIPYYTPYFIFGMSGMIIPIGYLPFIISLSVIILASIIFGRRAYCGVVCMAAHMYNNSFYDQFRAKKDSKIWNYIRFLSIIPLFVVFAIFLTNTPIVIHVELDPADVLSLYGMLVLNYVWWFFYFLTPIFGSYSCVRQGWCGFGSFVGLFNKLLFKVKAKQKDVCANCSAKSCDVSCPVKIPVSYDTSTKGYVNRITCIGCGNCVEACPYDNLIIFDITKLFRK